VKAVAFPWNSNPHIPGIPVTDELRPVLNTVYLLLQTMDKLPQNHSFVEATVQSSRDLTFLRRMCFWEVQKSNPRVKDSFRFWAVSKRYQFHEVFATPEEAEELIKEKNKSLKIPIQNMLYFKGWFNFSHLKVRWVSSKIGFFKDAISKIILSWDSG